MKRTTLHKAALVAALVLVIFVSVPKMALSDEVLALADWMLEHANYEEAITEYKRFIFFNPNSELRAYALFKMGMAYRSLHQWQHAVLAFESSIQATHDSREADERRLVLGTTLIASGKYDLARLKLLKVSEFTPFESMRLRALYYGGVASLYAADWDSAREAFGDFYDQYPGAGAKERAKQVRSALKEAPSLYRSTKKAKILSAVFPGLGQMYAGNWRDGLNALVINGLTMGLLASAIRKRDTKYSALAFSLVLRYYRGNIRKAGADVRRYNNLREQKKAMEVLDLVALEEPSAISENRGH